MCENKQLLYLVDPFPDPASQNIYIFNETVYSNPLTPQSSHPPPPPLHLSILMNLIKPQTSIPPAHLHILILIKPQTSIPPRTLIYPDPYEALNLNPPTLIYPDPYEALNLNPPAHLYMLAPMKPQTSIPPHLYILILMKP